MFGETDGLKQGGLDLGSSAQILVEEINHSPIVALALLACR
jgi:hypothetical protein